MNAVSKIEWNHERVRPLADEPPVEAEVSHRFTGNELKVVGFSIQWYEDMRC